MNAEETVANILSGPSHTHASLLTVTLQEWYARGLEDGRKEAESRAEAAEKERDQWREDARVLKAEVEVRRNAPLGIKGGAHFPYCPERAAWICDCQQCQWADRIHAACLDTNRSGALTRAGGGE